MLEQKGACFINAKGKVWEIGASGLQLWETPERSLSYSDYDELFDAIRKRINAKKKAGYKLAGNRLAEESDRRARFSEIPIEKVKQQFGERVSMWTDPWLEFKRVLSETDPQSGKVLIINGDLIIDGDWNLSEYDAVLILGDCRVDGLLFQYETHPWLVVSGNLNVHDLVVAGNLDVGGSLEATRSAEFESNLGYAHIGGELSAEVVFLHDMPLHCMSAKIQTLVSVTQNDDYLRSEKKTIGAFLGRNDSPLMFSDCLLDLNGYSREEAIEEDCVELQLRDRELIHLLRLDIFSKIDR